MVLLIPVNHKKSRFMVVLLIPVNHKKIKIYDGFIDPS